MKNELAKLFLESSSLLMGTDWILKSFAILSIALFLSLTLNRLRANSSTRHLLWLYSIVCLSLLPFAALGLGSIPTVPLLTGNVFTINTDPEYTLDLVTQESSSFPISLLLLTCYFSVVALLLLRILVGLTAVSKICRCASNATDVNMQLLIKKLSADLGLSRSIDLQITSDFASPFACGVFNPKIVLPKHSENWSHSTLKNVLLHELMHIKRLDWITMLSCHLICCVYWINPLSWIALKRLNDEAESSCDSAVLAEGIDAGHYAESLVYVARHSRSDRILPVQMMSGGQQLSDRINTVFEHGNNRASIPKKLHLPLMVFCLFLISSFSNLKMVSANSVSGSSIFNSARYLVPEQIAAPQYPSSPSEGNVSGSHILRFAVMKTGFVDPKSIAFVSANPGPEFYRASFLAVSKLKFEPPQLEGVNTEIPNVHIKIDYDGKEEIVRASILDPQLTNREYLPQNYFTPAYPSKALQENIEGYVLLEFSITQQGTVAGVVILDRDPSTVFNASAVEAIERLKFKPRLVDGVPTQVHGIQYLVRYDLEHAQAEPIKPQRIGRVSISTQ